MGSYKCGYKSPNMGYMYSYTTYNYHEPPSSFQLACNHAVQVMLSKQFRAGTLRATMDCRLLRHDCSLQVSQCGIE